MLKFYGRAAGDYLKFRSAHVFVAPRSRAKTRQQHHPEEEVHHDATVGSSLLTSPSLRIAGTTGRPDSLPSPLHNIIITLFSHHPSSFVVSRL